MQNITIRQLHEKDIGFAYEMVKTEQWNVREDDIERMLRYEPKGCFLAEASGESVGHVFTINYGRLGWIGLLIVKANHRRAGIARQLMETARRHLLNLGVRTIQLEAIPLISGLYRDMGFVDEYDSLRFKGVRNQSADEKSHSVKEMRQEEIGDIARFDAHYFGASRARVLSSLYQACPELCLVSHSESRISGYIMCREGEVGYNLGPWVCEPENTQAATDLLITCLRKTSNQTQVFVGAPAADKSAIEILQNFGFVQYSKSIRMQFGEQLTGEHIQGVFAIGGGMKG
jgi:predicted N-acetyltransferase YhbS